MKCHYLVPLVASVVLSSSEVCQAQAQVQPPNPTDLHAAYCIAVLQDTAGRAREGLAELQPPKNEPPEPPAMRDAREKALASGQSALDEVLACLRKIRLYLVPRIMYLDPTGLVAASTAAKEDLARLSKAADSCTNRCIAKGDLSLCTTACMRQEMPDLPGLQKKWKSCSEPDWLPF